MSARASPRTRRIAITGIDGTGKTTLIRMLGRGSEGHGSFIRAFRAPQFHECPEVPHAQLSADIDAIGVLGDRRGDPLLKASSLFLSMTLYGDVERYFIEKYRPGYLFGERQPLLDSLVYALFYAKLLRSPLDQVSLMPELVKEIGSSGLERLACWMGTLSQRSRDASLGRGLESFWSLPVYARSVFELPIPELLERLSVLYGVEPPEEVVLLEVSSDELQSRLRQKRSLGTERELHERKEVLEQLQRGLKTALVPLLRAFPRLRVHEINTTGLSTEESRDRILRAVGARAEVTGSLRA